MIGILITGDCKLHSIELHVSSDQLTAIRVSKFLRTAKLNIMLHRTDTNTRIIHVWSSRVEYMVPTAMNRWVAHPDFSLRVGDDVEATLEYDKAEVSGYLHTSILLSFLYATD